MAGLTLERKITEFPDDLRFIGEFEVFITPNGEMRVKAEVRLASELSDEH